MSRRGPGKGDYDVGYGKPPVAGRFAKGASGNPNGRPRTRSVVSPFDLVLDQTLTVGADGHRREVTAEEALQQALLQKAFAGDRPAIRKVLKMIQQRQAAMTAGRSDHPVVRVRDECPDPRTANAALRLLGLAEDHDRWGKPQLALYAWAVQAALARPRAPALGQQDVALIRNSSFDPENIRWPGAAE